MSKLVEQMLVNRGFTSQRLDSESITTEELKAWHTVLDSLLNECYDLYSRTHNNAIKGIDNALSTFGNNMVIVDNKNVYDVLKPIISFLNEDLARPVKISADMITTLSAKSAILGNKKSAELQFVYSQKSNAQRYLRELESINGSSEESMQNIRNSIAVYDAKIEELKGMSDNLYKEVRKISKNVWYKTCEDFFADCITQRLCMTEEQVKAEEEAIRQARRAKTRAKKTQKESVLVK